MNLSVPCVQDDEGDAATTAVRFSFLKVTRRVGGKSELASESFTNMPAL